MPVNPTFPGVYIEEIPSGVRTLIGVATSIAAFIDRFPRGLLGHPVQIFSSGDFEREFGGLDALSEASYGIYQFFLNGGTEAWVVRVAGPGSAAAGVQILSGIGGSPALTLEAGRGDASNPGVWGNGLRVRVEQPEGIAAGLFNLTVLLVELRRNQEAVLATEVFRNLSMVPDSPRFVQRVINDELNGSKFVRVPEATPNVMPLPNGTLSGEIAGLDEGQFPDSRMINVSIGTEGEAIVRLTEAPSSVTQAAKILESAIRAARPELPSFAQAQVQVAGPNNNQLRILAGPIRPGSSGRPRFHREGSGEVFATLGLHRGMSVDGLLSQPISEFPEVNDEIQVTIGGNGPFTLSLDQASTNLEETGNNLEAAIRGADSGNEAFTNARVIESPDNDNRLIVLPGTPGVRIVFSPVDEQEEVLANLGLSAENAAPIAAFISGPLPEEVDLPDGETERTLSFSIGELGPFSALAGAAGENQDLADVASSLQAAMRESRTNPAVSGIRVSTHDDPDLRLIIVPASVGPQVFFGGVTENEHDFIEGDDPDTQTVESLRLTEAGGVQTNVQTYVFGAGPALSHSGQGLGVPGADGNPPDAPALIAGIEALDDVDLFNILCLPRASQVTGNHALSEGQSQAVMTRANAYCEEHRAFYIVDPPSNVNEVAEAKAWLQNSGLAGRRNAALYFPQVAIPDPLNEFRLRSFGPSGTLAGLYARTDGTRGVWKAPAGTEATLVNVQGFEYLLNDPENGTLNQRGINCLRQFPVFGRVSWGARTLDGDDQIGSEWKYVPVRRTALFIEESLFRGTQWVVFEPNDEPLWAQIRLNIGAFMQNLFRQGAFQGKTPREAYLVKCDSETTTQNDINLGIVNIIVGFAPLKPAEFVIIKIQQLAGQIQT